MPSEIKKKRLAYCLNDGMNMYSQTYTHINQPLAIDYSNKMVIGQIY